MGKFIDIPVFNHMSKDECCGCEACLNSCPFNCISMDKNIEGFSIPVCDEDLCKKCDVCVKKCPALKEKKNEKIEFKTYAGFANNDNLVKKSASGGIYTLIAESFFNADENNSYICGVVWSDDFKSSKHIITNKIEDLEKIRSSKYIQSKKGFVYRDIKELLLQNKRVLFTGCPCEVAGLKSYLGKDYDNLFTIDLVCQGPTTPMAMDQFVDYIENKYNSKIKNLNMRYVKTVPWIPQWIKIDFNNNKTYLKVFYETAIGRCVHLLQRSSCYNCSFNKYNRYSDITLGDYHGADPSKKYYNQYGTSIVISNTTKGEKLLSSIQKEKVNLIKSDYDEISKPNPRLVGTWNKSPLRDSFSKDLVNLGLIKASKNSFTIRQKIRIKVPYSIREWLREKRKLK